MKSYTRRDFVKSSIVGGLALVAGVGGAAVVAVVVIVYVVKKRRGAGL